MTAVADQLGAKLTNLKERTIDYLNRADVIAKATKAGGVKRCTMDLEVLLICDGCPQTPWFFSADTLGRHQKNQGCKDRYRFLQLSQILPKGSRKNRCFVFDLEHNADDRTAVFVLSSCKDLQKFPTRDTKLGKLTSHDGAPISEGDELFSDPLPTTKSVIRYTFHDSLYKNQRSLDHYWVDKPQERVAMYRVWQNSGTQDPAPTYSDDQGAPSKFTRFLFRKLMSLIYVDNHPLNDVNAVTVNDDTAASRKIAASSAQGRSFKKPRGGKEKHPIDQEIHRVDNRLIYFVEDGIFVPIGDKVYVAAMSATTVGKFQTCGPSHHVVVFLRVS
jgi:hypothetical protein